MCKAINMGIDECLKPLIKLLNKGGFKTVASCCGHGKQMGNIALADGRELIICPDFETGRKIDKMFPPINEGFEPEKHC